MQVSANGSRMVAEMHNIPDSDGRFQTATEKTNPLITKITHRGSYRGGCPPKHMYFTKKKLTVLYDNPYCCEWPVLLLTLVYNDCSSVFCPSTATAFSIQFQVQIASLLVSLYRRAQMGPIKPPRHRKTLRHHAIYINFRGVFKYYISRFSSILNNQNTHRKQTLNNFMTECIKQSKSPYKWENKIKFPF